MFHVVFILLASFPFFESENTEFFNRSKDMLNCVEYIYIVNTKCEGHGATTSLKLGLVFAYIKCQKYNCFA